MKKLFIIAILFMTIGLSACNMKDISNIDIQKLNQKATEYMNAGEYDKAVSRLEAITDLNPDFYETYYNLGVAYYQMQKYEDSIKAFDNTLERKNDLADAYFARAVAYEDWGYSILEPEAFNFEGNQEKKTFTKEDEIKANEYLQNAKNDYEKYLELNKNSNDKEEVENKITELDKKLNGETEEQKEN